MDQLESDLARFKQPAMAVVGGIAAALVVATLPHVYLESIVGATGIAEIVPAAAPPLGNTARGLIAIAAGLVATSAIFVYLNRKGSSDMGLAIRRNLTPEPEVEGVEDTSRPASSKKPFSVKSLTKFLKKPKKDKVTDLADLPERRKSDEHPDAPARPPLFAASDLGTPIADQIKPFEKPSDLPSAPESSAELQPRTAPAPLAEETAPPEPQVARTSFVADRSLQVPEPVEPPVETPEPVVEERDEIPPAVQAIVEEDLSSLSIAQLADRLEAGLAQLKALHGVESAPAASMASPVAQVADPEPVSMPPLRSVETPEPEAQTARQADMDAALKAALGTLERMTAQR